MGWLSGSYQEPAAPPEAKREISPPDEEVRREMLRMEIAAIEARMEAERAELATELALDPGERAALDPGERAAPEPVSVSDESSVPPADPQVEGDSRG